MENKPSHQVHSVVFLNIRNQTEVDALIHDLGLVLIIKQTSNPSNPICDIPVAD